MDMQSVGPMVPHLKCMNKRRRRPGSNDCREGQWDEVGWGIRTRLVRQSILGRSSPILPGQKARTCPRDVSREMQRGTASAGTYKQWDGAKVRSEAGKETGEAAAAKS